MCASLCYHNDVIRSRDVIGHVTVRLSIDDFLYVLSRNHTCISLSYHDAITDVTTPGSTSYLYGVKVTVKADIALPGKWEPHRRATGRHFCPIWDHTVLHSGRKI